MRKYIFLFAALFTIPSLAQLNCDYIDPICQKARELMSQGQYDQALSGLQNAKNDPGIRNCSDVYMIDDLINVIPLGKRLKAVVEKAKAEGANWTEDQWKTAIKDATKAMKPMLLEANELQKKAEAAKTDEEKVAFISEAAKMMEKYKDLEAQMTEFGKLIEGNPIAKKLNDDKAFEAEVEKELGLEGILW